MPNERHYSNELNLESVGINLPYNMQAEQSVLGAVLLKPDPHRPGGDHPAGDVLHPAERADLSEMLRCSPPTRPSTLSPCWTLSSRTACSPVPTKRRST